MVWRLSEQKGQDACCGNRGISVMTKRSKYILKQNGHDICHGKRCKMYVKIKWFWYMWGQKGHNICRSKMYSIAKSWFLLGKNMIMSGQKGQDICMAKKVLIYVRVKRIYVRAKGTWYILAKGILISVKAIRALYYKKGLK